MIVVLQDEDQDIDGDLDSAVVKLARFNEEVECLRSI